MKINFAVERLYQTGWLPVDGMDLERLPNNGLRYPTVSAIQKCFRESGLELSIKPHLMFGCCRAEWTSIADDPEGEELSGTVVGSCEREAAVHALATLREQLAEVRMQSGESLRAMATV